jgi:nitrogen fixation protein FixH
MTTKRSARWPAAIVGLITLHAAGMVAVILIATRDPSFAVEPDHYQKALAWDAFSARARASQALGWTASAHSESSLDGAHTRGLDVTLTGRDGAPVAGAQVAVLAFSHARGGERIRVDLVEAAPGHYAARAPMVRTGIWELRLLARRGPDSFTTTVLHTIGESP